MFNQPYPFCCLGKAETTDKHLLKTIRYKFYARHRTYLVTFELYSFDIVAVKYCDVKDKRSRKAYHKVFNDHDAFKVIGTCFHIMHQYWKKNTNVNFMFYASLRDIQAQLLEKKTLAVDKIPSFIESYAKVRYSIYRYGMVNLFPYKYFTPVTEKKNCIYVLINKNEPRPSHVLSELIAYLSDHHDIIFNPD